MALRPALTPFSGSAITVSHASQDPGQKTALGVEMTTPSPDEPTDIDEDGAIGHDGCWFGHLLQTPSGETTIDDRHLAEVPTKERIHDLLLEEGVVDEYAQEPGGSIVRIPREIEVCYGECGLPRGHDVLTVAGIGDHELHIRQSFVDHRNAGCVVQGQTGLTWIENELIREGSVEGFGVGIRRHTIEIILDVAPDDAPHGGLNITLVHDMDTQRSSAPPSMRFSTMKVIMRFSDSLNGFVIMAISDAHSLLIRDIARTRLGASRVSLTIDSM